MERVSPIMERRLIFRSPQVGTCTILTRFMEFCYWSQGINSNGSPLPANEWTLMLFVTALSRSLKASSIKVYLAGVRSLHVENGFGNQWRN